MATPLVLQNLAKMVDLRIEALTDPVAPGQPQVFQIRPASLLLSPLGELIPTDPVLTAAIPVSLEVTWSVVNQKGDALTSSEAVIHAPVTDPLITTVNTGLVATVLVLPDFVELRREQIITTKTRYVTASIKLIATQNGRPIAEQTVPLLRHPITIPAVPVPTVALFFRHKSFGLNAQSGDGKFALVVVPSDSAIAGISALRDACDTLRRLSETASTLVSLASLATGLPALTGLDAGLSTLLDALDAHVPSGRVGLAFASGDTVGNLNDIDMITEPWYASLNDIEAEDEISSLILVGPPRRRMKVYKDRKATGWGVMITCSNHCVTLVRNFDSSPPTSEPPGFTGQTDPGSFNDRMSSLSFL